ncbi:unnamed protein product [Aspergillus oryzae]|nr:unnamed protein product [Aspergillus oryzae]GMF91613.1 unnamed protein product [Aspergillus oryzae]
MKINNRCVSVDVRSTLNRSVRVPVDISCPDVSFAPVNDDIEEDPTSPENICFAFTVIEVSPPLEDSPQPCEITVTLKSELQETFLAVDPSDRRLILKDLEEAGERSQNHHFILRPDAQPIDRDDTFIGIIPADQGMICHGDDSAEEVSLCLRLLGISRGNKAVEAAWIEQLAIFSVVEEDTESVEEFGIAGKSPKPASYLDNKRLLDKVEEMVGEELDEAKAFLGCQYDEGRNQMK